MISIIISDHRVSLRVLGGTPPADRDGPPRARGGRGRDREGNSDASALRPRGFVEFQVKQ